MIGLVALIVARRDPGLLRDRLPVRPAFPVADAARRRPRHARSCSIRPPRPLHSPLNARLRHLRDPNSGVNLAVNLVVLFLVVDLAGADLLDLRRRPAADRRPRARRLRDRASLFPFVGTIVYMIVRPPEYLEDVRERELEMQAAEARLAQLGYHRARTATTRSRRTSCAARAAMRKRGSLRELRQAARDALEGVPVLRGRDRRSPRRPPRRRRRRRARAPPRTPAAEQPSAT